jgi:hypothetical protein
MGIWLGTSRIPSFPSYASFIYSLGLGNTNLQVCYTSRSSSARHSIDDKALDDKSHVQSISIVSSIPVLLSTSIKTYHSVIFGRKALGPDPTFQRQAFVAGYRRHCLYHVEASRDPLYTNPADVENARPDWNTYLALLVGSLDTSAFRV